MLGLPKSTEFNRRIPKQKFYENLSVTPVLKRFFIDQIKVIYWRNKIAPTTMNLAAGEAVTEIEVIEIRLSVPQLDVSVLKQIDRKSLITFCFCWNTKVSIRHGPHTKSLPHLEAALSRLEFTIIPNGCLSKRCL